MIPTIAPFGVSDDATHFIRHALELEIGRRYSGFSCRKDLVYCGLLSATLKLYSPDRQALESEAERQGLARLLATAAELLEHARRDLRGSRLNLEGDPKGELEDLRRRARYPIAGLAACSRRRYAKAI